MYRITGKGPTASGGRTMRTRTSPDLGGDSGPAVLDLELVDRCGLDVVELVAVRGRG